MTKERGVFRARFIQYRQSADAFSDKSGGHDDTQHYISGNEHTIDYDRGVIDGASLRDVTDGGRGGRAGSEGLPSIFPSEFSAGDHNLADSDGIFMCAHVRYTIDLERGGIHKYSGKGNECDWQCRAGHDTAICFWGTGEI